MKEFIKRIASQVAVSAAFVAVDQAVRTVVDKKIKSKFFKSDEK